MQTFKKYHPSFFLLCIGLIIGSSGWGQITPPSEEDTLNMLPVPTVKERAKNWGPNDTMVVSAIWYKNELMPFRELENVWVSKMAPEKLAKYVQEWTRLRNAVYVTYPYARLAGVTINDINAHLTNIHSKKERKAYIKTREKELKTQFGDPISELSVYQGRVLMKLINRQTGNNCYEIVKEYRGGVTARFYQTVAFFFGSSMKQNWDVSDKTDRQIENFVKEIDGVWYNNPYRAN